MVTNSTNAAGQQVAGATALRLFPQELVQQFNGTERLPDRRKQLITLCSKFRAHASYLGFPAITRLARKLEDTLQRLPTGEARESQAWSTVDTAITHLTHAVADPHNNHLANQVDDLCESLSAITAQLNTQTTDTDTVPLLPFAATSTGELGINVSSEADAQRIEHHDLDIYHRELLGGLEKCSDEESWLVAQVATAAEELAGRQSDQRPAKKLLSILNGHRFFQDVDRASIVGLIPGSNQLVVVDSAIHSRMRDLGIPNHMPPGYSCFINPTGSLTTLKPGLLRIFDDSSQVLNSFAREGKPAQRSIAYIAEAGLKSGICLAIGRGETVQGYMFLNSLKPSLFNHVMRDYAPLLSLFALIGTISLDAAGFHLAACQAVHELPSSIPRHSTLFDRKELEQYVAQCLHARTGTPCTVNIRIAPALQFLYAPAMVAPVVAKAALGLGLAHIGASGSVELNVLQYGERISFALEVPENNATNAQWLGHLVHELSSGLLNQPCSITHRNGVLCIDIPCEPVLEPNSAWLYSVAY